MKIFLVTKLDLCLMLSTAGNTVSSERLELGRKVGHCTLLDTERSQKTGFCENINEHDS